MSKYTVWDTSFETYKGIVTAEVKSTPGQPKPLTDKSSINGISVRQMREQKVMFLHPAIPDCALYDEPVSHERSKHMGECYVHVFKWQVSEAIAKEKMSDAPEECGYYFQIFEDGQTDMVPLVPNRFKMLSSAITFADENGYKDTNYLVYLFMSQGGKDNDAHSFIAEFHPDSSCCDVHGGFYHGDFV